MTLKQQLHDETFDGELSHLSVLGLNYVVFMSSAWKNVGMTTMFQITVSDSMFQIKVSDSFMVLYIHRNHKAY